MNTNANRLLRCLRVEGVALAVFVCLSACDGTQNREADTDTTVTVSPPIVVDTLAMSTPQTRTEYDQEVRRVRERYPQARTRYRADTVGSIEYPTGMYSLEVEGIEDTEDRNRFQRFADDYRRRRAERRRALTEAEVDVPAQPKGGYNAFYQLVKENLKYPEDALAESVEGTVFVEFDVNDRGVVSNLDVVETSLSDTGYDPMAGPGGNSSFPDDAVVEKMSEEAKSAVAATSGKWTPAQLNKQMVTQRMELPITFQIQR